MVPVATHDASAEFSASAQGNMLSNADVTRTMLATYIRCRQQGELDFGQCLLTALAAGEAVGKAATSASTRPGTAPRSRLRSRAASAPAAVQH